MSPDSLSPSRRYFYEGQLLPQRRGFVTDVILDEDHQTLAVEPLTEDEPDLFQEVKQHHSRTKVVIFPGD